MTPTLIWAAVAALTILCLTAVLIAAIIKAPPTPPQDPQPRPHHTPTKEH